MSITAYTIIYINLVLRFYSDDKCPSISLVSLFIRNHVEASSAQMPNWYLRAEPDVSKPTEIAAF